MKRVFVLILLFAIALPNIFACRFTIREIGYTRLNIEKYRVVLKGDTAGYGKLVKQFRALAYGYSMNANISYTVLNEKGKMPELTCLNGNDDVIVREEVVTAQDIREFFKKLLFSPLQKMMYSQIGNVFAFVVAFPGEDNVAVNNIIDKAFSQFQKLMPNLDKKVDENIMKIVIPQLERKEEALVMRALGIDPESKQSSVVVIYGRGRLADEPLKGEKITTHNLLNQLVTLGTDCECGIDLSPLLRRAIPFNWDDKMSQAVADMLDIDVENPMVLTEMSRILSKEPLETGKSEFSFAPQTIDLDKELNKGKQQEDVVVEKSSPALKVTALIVGALALLIIFAGIVMFRKRK